MKRFRSVQKTRLCLSTLTHKKTEEYKKFERERKYEIIAWVLVISFAIASKIYLEGLDI